MRCQWRNRHKAGRTPLEKRVEFPKVVHGAEGDAKEAIREDRSLAEVRTGLEIRPRRQVAMLSSGSEPDDLSSCGNVALVWIELLLPAADLTCPALQLCSAQRPVELSLTCMYTRVRQHHMKSTRSLSYGIHTRSSMAWFAYCTQYRRCLGNGIHHIQPKRLALVLSCRPTDRLW